MPLWTNRTVHHAQCPQHLRTARRREPWPDPAADLEGRLASAIAFALFHFLVRGVFAAKPAEFVALQPVRIILLVLHGRIVSPLAERAGHRDHFAHRSLPLNTTPEYYATISVTMPEPTVLPPSRMANRNPWSMAIGEINSAATVTLSPGITISTPGFN